MSEEIPKTGTDAVLDMMLIQASQGRTISEMRREYTDLHTALTQHVLDSAELHAVAADILREERDRLARERNAEERSEKVMAWLTTKRGLAVSGVVVAGLSSVLSQYFPWLQAIFDAFTKAAP